MYYTATDSMHVCIGVGGWEEGVPAGNSVDKSTLPRLKSVVSLNPTQAAVVVQGVVELFALLCLEVSSIFYIHAHNMVFWE